MQTIGVLFFTTVLILLPEVVLFLLGGTTIILHSVLVILGSAILQILFYLTGITFFVVALLQLNLWFAILGSWFVALAAFGKLIRMRNDGKWPEWLWIPKWASSVCHLLFLGLCAVVLYLAGSEPDYSLISVLILTAVGLVLLFVTTFMSSPQDGWIQKLRSY